MEEGGSIALIEHVLLLAILLVLCSNTRTSRMMQQRLEVGFLTNAALLEQPVLSEDPEATDDQTKS